MRWPGRYSSHDRSPSVGASRFTFTLFCIWCHVTLYRSPEKVLHACFVRVYLRARSQGIPFKRHTQFTGRNESEFRFSTGKKNAVRTCVQIEMEFELEQKICCIFANSNE